MYQYSLAVSRVESIAASNLRSNAIIQVHDLSNSLANRIRDVKSTLQILSNSPAIQTKELDATSVLLASAEDANSDLVDFYMRLDRDGKLVSSSGTNETAREKYAGIDLSYRSYFSKPKETVQINYGSSITS